MLNIGDSSIRYEEYQCTPTNPNLNSVKRSSGLETGQQKINAIEDT